MGKTCLPEEEFDFDAWSELARSDPETFDQCRQKFLEKAVQLCTGDKQRLNRLQCRIDLERRKARVPLKACIRLSSLMWDSFHELNERLNVPPQLAMAHATEPPTARILPFRSPPPD